MARAVAPKVYPDLPENMTQWRRSTRRGSMFHAVDSLGGYACRPAYMDRHKSEQSNGSLGDMQYWGVCPRCHAKSLQALAKPQY